MIDGTLVVMTYNIGGRPAKKAGNDPGICISDVIGKVAPDILFLQESRERDIAFLAETFGMEYSFFFPYKGKSRSGLAVLSKYPLFEPVAHSFPASKNGLGYAMCEVVVGDRPILLVNLHLDRNKRVMARNVMPRVPLRTALGVVREEIFEETTRYRQMGMVLEGIDSDRPETIIIAGDFNTIPLSTTIHKVHDRFQDALWPSFAYFSNTFSELGFPFKPRIDYIFHSHEIQRKRAGIIRSGPGDHFPVWAEFRVRS